MMVAVAAPAAAAAKQNKKIGNAQHATPSKQRDESAYVRKEVRMVKMMKKSQLEEMETGVRILTCGGGKKYTRTKVVMLHSGVFQFLAGRRCETRGGNHISGGGVLLHGSVIHAGSK